MVSDYYTLAITHEQENTLLTMNLSTPFVNTREIPSTYLILNEYLPSILRSKCKNPDKRPFREECKQTELGHLFEHILLEYLRDIKMARLMKKKLFRGVTRWNWIQDRRGTFHISIETEKEDEEIFSEALDKTVLLMNKILISKLQSNKKSK